jgi:lauroyl/myristoyl acyltransferase
VSAPSEAVRLAILRGVLRPAADLLPRSGGMRLADLTGDLLAQTPHGTAVRRDFARMFAGLAGERLARGWLARPFRDFVMLRRFLVGREELAQWRIEQRMPPPTSVLIRSGAPLVLATGHFAREAALALYARALPPSVHVSALVAPLPPASPRSLARARQRLLYGQMLRACTASRTAIDLVYVHDRRALATVLRRLAQHEQAVVLAADATDWTDLVRPFAGERARGFAVGCARLARLAGCPLVVCVPYVDAGGAIVLEWSAPLGPPPLRDRGADRELTSLVLDRLEEAVGERPDQYVLPIGRSRRWNPESRRWEPAGGRGDGARAPGRPAMGR